MKAVKLTPSHRIYGLGAILLVSLLICSRNFTRMGDRSFLVPLAVASIAYLLAISEFFSTPRFPRRVIVPGLVLAALWHLQFLGVPPGPDDDIHRYLWDGRVQRVGFDPYLVVPDDPAFSGLHTSESRSLDHPDVPSPYPAGAELFFRTVTAIHESTFVLKVEFVFCDFAAVLVLLDVLRWSRQGMHWVLAYAWQSISIAGNWQG
jgi:alpha-1,6-mannosyltransferase